MPEGLRDYLLRTFRAIYSGYGATDLEIGLAGETPFSVAVRRLAREDERVREVLFGHDSRPPMLFQYNPLVHQITTNETGELAFTIERLEVLSPRIEYNIQDEGGLATFADLGERLRSAGVDPGSLVGRDDPKPVPLPFVWIYGRKDSTVSLMGANLYPKDVEQALYAEPTLANVTHSYCLGLEEGDTPSPRPVFSFEVRVPTTSALHAQFEAHVLDRVRSLNADFRVALDEHPAVATPIIRLFALGEGPFAHDEGRIKQTRVIRLSAGVGTSAWLRGSLRLGPLSTRDRRSLGVRCRLRGEPSTSRRRGDATGRCGAAARAQPPRPPRIDATHRVSRGCWPRGCARCRD